MPDVAFDGDPADRGPGLLDRRVERSGSWLTVGGTSLGAPAWAGIVAVADQGRVLAGAKPLGSLQTLTALYGLPASDFHSIGGGYNTQTGRGTPVGNLVVAGLVSFNVSTTAIAADEHHPDAHRPDERHTRLPVINRPIRFLPVVSQPVSMPAGVSSSRCTVSQPVVSLPVLSQPATTTSTNDPVGLTPIAHRSPPVVTTKHAAQTRPQGEEGPPEGQTHAHSSGDACARRGFHERDEVAARGGGIA